MKSLEKEASKLKKLQEENLAMLSENRELTEQNDDFRGKLSELEYENEEN